MQLLLQESQADDEEEELPEEVCVMGGAENVRITVLAIASLVHCLGAWRQKVGAAIFLRCGVLTAAPPRCPLLHHGPW